MLASVLKLIGWVFTLLPLTIAIGVSVVMIIGAGNDDDTIKALTLLGLTIFVMGVIILLLVYLSGLFEGGELVAHLI